MRGLQNKIKMICKTLKDLKSVLRGCQKKKIAWKYKNVCERFAKKRFSKGWLIYFWHNFTINHIQLYTCLKEPTTK